MPVVSDKLYRANSGREALDVRVVGMDWTEAIDLLSANPRKFVDWGKAEFEADSEDGIVNPSLQTVLKRFQREGLRHGVIVGSNINTESDDETEHVLSVTARPNVTKFPKWAVKLMNEGVVFGELIIEDDADDDTEVDA